MAMMVKTVKVDAGMLTKWQWTLDRLRREIWFPVSLYGLLAVGTALAAALFGRFVSDDLSAKLGAESVGNILNILASSMLTVTTFSLSIMVAAFSSAATGATPRATQLLQDDKTTQHVLASFVGGFLFSLVGIIGLQTGIYQQGGRFILFAVTLLVIFVIVGNLLRWIVHMTDYGRLVDTLSRVETAAAKAFQRRMTLPYLGAGPLDTSRAAEFALTGAQVLSRKTGYVQMINIPTLQKLMEKAEAHLAVLVLPGTSVHVETAVVRVTPSLVMTETLADAIRDAFEIADLRTFDQDPRFGVITLTEIASRALSPAVNDPGTAIDVLSRQLRLLSGWRDGKVDVAACDRVFVPGLEVADVVADAFGPIARDGAGVIEVQLRLQKTLLALAQIDRAKFGAAVVAESARAMLLAEAAILVPRDLALLRDLHADIVDACARPTSGLSQARSW